MSVTLKRHPDNIFKIQSVAHPTHYLQVKDGSSEHGAELIVGPEVPGSKNILFRVDTESIQNVATGTYAVWNESGAICSKTPQAWKIHEHDDGHHCFQVSGQDVFATATSDSGSIKTHATTKTSSHPGQKWKIVVV
ncbi:hypothetical protein M422DRAFT_259350 [Sphaerobolus stellatus SS14]|uniref:Uncharacterized protein n=1 Tax=Sphaerobolus stellatus (strain SS14) TaxID=990650 RepID=A0A0C9VKJ0_SPHS4|nr:hypothetical protein M422DRAFT_259350 [Sphaerobolus stellatus SS14]